MPPERFAGIDALRLHGMETHVLERLKAAAVVVDLRGTIIYVNPAAELMYGISADQLVGQSSAGLTGVTVTDATAREILAALESGGTWEGEFELRRPDGTVLTVRALDSALYDASGRIAGVLSIVVDLSGHAALEHQLAEDGRVAETLFRIGQVLTAELDLYKVVNEVVALGTELTSAELGAFFYKVPHAAGWSYQLFSLTGVSEQDFAGLPLPGKSPLFEAIFRGEAVIRIADVTADPPAGLAASYHGLPPGHPPVRSFLAAPVISRSGEVIGGMFFGHHQPGVFTSGDERLVSGIAAQAGISIENARLYDAEQRARASAEAAAERAQRLAEVLQTSLLPPALPDIPGIEVAARYRPGMDGLEVGGDFYDVFATGGDWGVVMGDVCGKGPDAAALTALVRYSVRAAAVDLRQPASILLKVNEVLLRDPSSERFCTLAYGRLLATAEGIRLTVCRAGHPAPLVLRSGGVEVVGAAGTALGLFDRPRLLEETILLSPGDAVVFYTDGITEAGRGADRFGDDRLAGVLATCRGLSAAEVARKVEEAALDFARSQPHDDLAITVLRVD
jgi:PAS domain S-box-containing protein